MPSTARPRRAAAIVLAATLAATGLAMLPGASALAAVATPDVATAYVVPPPPPAPVALPAGIDPVGPYIPQASCDPTEKPGVQLFRWYFMIHYYRIGGDDGLTRACADGALSEHKEGRAWDWRLSVNVPAEKAVADAVTTWITSPGPHGEVAPIARRLGIMYLIWNKRIWNVGETTNGAGGWKPYVGVSEHTDHVHFSFTWAGAMGHTSWWTGKVSVNDYGPCAVYTNNPAPRYSVANPTPCQAPVPTWTSTQPIAWIGTVSVAVRHAQALLGVPVDGGFYGTTQNAVYRFQLAHHLPLTAALDPPTWLALDPQTLGADGRAQGHVDSITATSGGLHVRGWSFDPRNPTASFPVYYWVDGRLYGSIANTLRTDVDAVFHHGPNHGFEKSIAVGVGSHQVCVTSNGTGVATAQFGCFTYRTPPNVPIGHLDSARVATGGTQVSGWALDADLGAAPITVDITVDGVLRAIATASTSRPDVDRAYHLGTMHGFSLLVRAGSTVCAYAVNWGGGPNPSLGCLAVH
jgi:peptidoglycan hydrolase-like protein with peptidoglycan-binding domain